MGEKLIKPYEISVWEDKLTQIEGSEPAEYKFEETKLAVIGSNTMTGLNKVYNPVFNKKSNGERTLSFSLKYKYFDPYSGSNDVINPFAALLVNERKVKLHYDNEWYEFIIKDHSESSDGLEWTYSCTDAFVLELSKNGYNITFDTELNNNQGTATELATETLKNTDWRVGESDTLTQLIAEPIYQAELLHTSDIILINASDNLDPIPGDNSDIYLFYSYVKNKNGKNVQFIIRDDHRQYTIDDKNVITDTNFRITTDLEFKDYFLVEDPTGNPQDQGWYELKDTEYVLTEDTTVESKEYYYFHPSFWLVNEQTETNIEIISVGDADINFQANRLVYNQLTTYDPVMQRTVDRFQTTDGQTDIYRYTDYEYTTSNVVLNYIANGENFNSLEDGTLQGWNPYTDQIDGAIVNKLSLITKPEIGTGKSLVDINALSQIEGFLKIQPNGPIVVENSKIYNTVYNSGIKNNASIIKSIALNEEFVFRWRAGEGMDINNLSPKQSLGLIVAKYTQDDPTRYGYYYKHIDTKDIILQFEGEPQELNNIITGGVIKTGTDGRQNYVIDNVVQTPSTKYIYEVEGVSYLWDGETGRFIEKTNQTPYLPYYYLTAQAEMPISNKVLTDPNEQIGIFVYAKEVSTETIINPETQEPETVIVPIYIQDIQLTRFIPDASEAKKPVVLGNIPNAMSNPQEFYYIKPTEGETAESITTYKTIDALKTDHKEITTEIVPLYNEKSEKNLSISVSKSNCFNILQTIAETFECWVDLVVGHDSEGYITSTEGKPDKYVYFREYVGKDNWAGFKYGTNLNSIERTSNSDEVVTKLIVDLSQSEYVDEGFVSIANAPSNQSGESYILNFDYYYSQGLLNREEAEADRLQFISDVKTLNGNLQKNEALRRDLETSLTSLGSNRNVFTELIASAHDMRNEALSDFQQLTGMSYEDYQKEHGELIEEEPESQDKKQLTDEETVVDVIGRLYTSSATINNYAGILTNVDEEYKGKRRQLYGSESYTVEVSVAYDSSEIRHIIVELNDYLPGFSFKLENDKTEYESTVSIRYFDIVSNAQTITFTAPEKYTVVEGAQDIDDEETNHYEINPTENVKGLIDIIKEIQAQKDELTNNFNNKYSRYIQEGTWNSTDYIDSELYYLDALQVSNTSAQPTVSYTINVVEVSELEGLENYSFDVGEKTYVEDTEFFGWHVENIGTEQTPNYVYTPVKEKVIISEVEWHFDEPDQNVITVQNYKTRFEDLFQRISATVQTVQYNEATYAKTSSLMDANGMLNQNVLLDSLNSISGQFYSLTSNGSVIIDGDRILVRNLQNPLNRVIINSEGIRVSSDGGQNWQTAIDGQGINIGAVYTGNLNTNRIVIGSEENPSFRWDRAGLSAYKYDSDVYIKTSDTAIDNLKVYYIYDESTDEYVEVLHPVVEDLDKYYENKTAYDLQTYVRYDQYGLYGIKNNSTFKAQSLQDVLDKAHFAVTWDGFFIKNSYPGGGRVEITSDNDFRVMNIPTGQSVEQEKIKIGALEWGKNGNTPIISPDAPGATTEPTLYGIRINNNAGQTVMKTGDDGNITITGTINANAGNFDGLVTVGKDENNVSKPYIEIDGRDSNDATIRSSRYVQDGASYGWMINADGDAVFNNITARGAIKTAVFEYSEIQAVGGLFIFRPSSTIRDAARVGETDDVTITVEKPYLFKVGDWCKVSNYTNSMNEPSAEAIMSNNGLTHVYKIKTIDSNNSRILVLENAYAALTSGNTKVIDNITDLIGGALVDMGNKANGNGQVGTNNYGIGINSSDNVVDLPRRAISLFETVVDETKNPKVSYNYRGILGTLPHMDSDTISPIYPAYMEGKQGIYTDNMYIGDKNQYIAFYKDSRGDSQLRLVAKSFEILPDDSDLPIDLGDSVVEQKTQYTLSTSTEENTVEEEWSDTPYEESSGYYLWQRTYVKYAKGRIQYLPTEDGYYMNAGQPGPQGPPGQAGEDAVNLVIDSSNGNTFKNSSVNTVLSVTIYKGTIIINNLVHLKEIFGNTAYLQWYWKRMGESDFHPISIDDSMLSNGGFNLTLTPDKVDVKVVFQCEIKTTEV